MRTKFTLICVILALMPFVRGYAQDYTGYNYVANFNTGTPLNGSISGAYLSTADEYLRFNFAGQAGARNSTFTLSPTTSFTKKLIVEFDWYATNYTGGSGDEGQVQFRSSGSNVLFTLYGLVGSSNQIGIATGTLNGGKAATVDARYRTSLTNTPASAWYHVKAEIYAGQRIAFTVTGTNDYIRKAMLPVPSGFSLASINSMYFNATRNGSNITWDARIDNIGIRVADTDADISASSVNITSAYDVISIAGNTALTADVLPFDVSSHAIIWSVDNALATVTTGYPSWTATLNGANSGTGTVTVTATSATAGVIATKQINVVQSVLLSNITVSGSASVAVNATATLTASVLPGNASNKNVVWESLNPEIATVSASGAVTGVSAGTATIKASAADGGGAQATHQINVTFTYVTSIDLQGARRIFYTPNPASIAAFTLTPTVLPADASLKTLAWSSTNEAIATVTSAGSVKLAGGFGKCAIKAAATDGSNVERCYYIEVAATNPYDVFSDFETSAAPFTGNRSSFQNTYAINFSGSGAGNRPSTWALTSLIKGGVINLKFDWWAGLVATAKNTGVLTIQDNTGSDGTAMIFSIVYSDTPGNNFRYLTGGYSASGDEPPQGINLENITAMNRWYTVDVTFNFHTNECEFTMTDRDNPAITQTVNNIPLSLVTPPAAQVGSIFVNGLRAATNNLDYTTAIDNFRYKVIDTSLPTYAVTGLTLSGLDQVAPGEKIMAYPKFAPLNARNKALTWESSNTGVATIAVDTKGRPIITGVSTGTAVIKAVSVENSSIFAEKTITVATKTLPQRQMERLDRGLVAVKVTNGVFLSWRLLGADPADVTFNLYKNGGATPVNPVPLAPAYTDFTDAEGTLQDTYQVAVLVGGNEIYRSAAASVWANQYKSIPVEKPTTGHLPTGEPYSNYTIYDGSAADLDGDGQYEIVFLWAPANLQDNSNGGQTGNVFIDAYKLDGTKLWGAGKYIDLGSNIRAGAHYSPFLVYDFDGNGKAEIIIRTADGTTDTQGNIVGENVVYANADGFVLNGPEFVSVFDGATGKLLDSAPYEPERGRVQDWGDGIGNRADRFLAAVAHLDGVKASAVMCRGYYTRTTLCAWDWDGKKLAKRWMFDTNEAGGQYKGQGNHNMSVADVDDDGKDEIIYGSLTIDDDGTAMYTTNLLHGDAMHVGKLDPTRPGLQYMGVHESPFPYGMEMHDLLTGDIIWGVVASGDIGRGLTADIDPNYPGTESWGTGGTFAADGTKISGSGGPSSNMAIYWDGNTGRELFDGQSNPAIRNVTMSGTAPNKTFGGGTLTTFSGASTNGGTKANPCLQADILGDWREEVILRSSDNSELRIYTTTIPTEHTGAGAVPSSGIPTLMHNKEYRMAVAWQNGGYNQPPHADVFIGYNMENVPRVENAAITITLDANGGTFDDNTALKQITSIYGSYIDLPAVTKSSSTFVGWYFADGTEYNPNACYTENITLIAAWTFTVTLNVNGGEISVEIGNKLNASQHFAIGEIPEPVRSCYEFKEWNLKEDGTGETVTAETIFDFNADITLYAQWIPVCPLEVLSVTPADGTTDVSIYVLPSVKLSDRVNLYGEPNLLRVKISGAMGVSASYSDSTITVAHSAELAANTAYTVTVPKTAVNNLAKDVVWTFSTGRAPIEVVATTPSGEGVMRDEVISITFSKNPYINAEPKWNLITVHNDNTNRNVEGLFVSGAGLSGNTYTVFHDLLDRNTDYTVTVPVGAVAGLAAPVIWTFKTGAEFINSANGLETAVAGISVYPTLTDGTVQINTANEAEIRLCDIAGKILEIRSSTGGTCELNLAERAAGVYFVVIATAEKTSVTKITKK